MPEIIVKLGDRVVQKYLLYKNQKLSIGRAPDNDIAIENPAVSRRHAMIEMVNGRYILEDNNSANGSYVNGVRVTKTEILDKDVLTIGKHKLHFYNADAPPPDVKVEPVMDESTMVVPEGIKGLDASLVGLGKQSGQSFTLSKVETRIGRAADNDVRLQDWFVSKHHAVIGRKGAVYVLRDLDSWRHTTVNGQVITETTLKDGDEIKFGPNIEMKFELSEAVEAAVRKPVELGEAPPAEAPLIEDIDAAAAEAAISESSEADIAASMPTHASSMPVEEVAASGEYSAEVEQAIEAAHGSQDEAPSVEPVQVVAATPHDTGSRRKKKKRRHQEAEAARPASAGDAVSAAEAAVAAVDAPMAEAAPEASVEVSESDNGRAPVAAGDTDLGQLSDSQREEVAMWEKALANTSMVIRKQAAKKLKQLTGRDYDIQ